MVLTQVDTTPTPEPDTSTAYIATTPPETVSADLDDHDPFGGAKPSSFSVPWPGSTFIIRSVSSGQVITLLDGQIVLAPLGGRGSIHWACMETKGWLGFRNHVSGGFLGHDKHGNLRCTASWHQTWEYFCVRMRPEGGYVLLMTHWDGLWHVGIKEHGKLAKCGEGGSYGTIWEFVKVE
jgi:hypothetical protein